MVPAPLAGGSGALAMHMQPNVHQAPGCLQRARGWTCNRGGATQPQGHTCCAPHGALGGHHVRVDSGSCSVRRQRVVMYTVCIHIQGLRLRHQPPAAAAETSTCPQTLG
jgi:hypothetical protein